MFQEHSVILSTNTSSSDISDKVIFLGVFMIEILQTLIEEIELSKEDSEQQDEGYNLGLNVAIIQIKKKIKELS
jgi:hypothetical protein